MTNLPIGLVYRHVGRKEFIDAGGHVHDERSTAGWWSTLEQTWMAPMVERLRARWLQVDVVPGFLADHAPINYATLI